MNVFKLKIIIMTVMSCAAIGAWGQAPNEHQHHSAPPTKAPELIVKIPDVKLLNQEGESIAVADLVKDKTVAINFIFTTCTTICPPLGMTFQAVQKQLNGRTDVALISITVDPNIDTPERLKEWANRFHAKPGWTLLTGEKVEVDAALKAFGGFSARKEEHSPVVIIGNAKQGQWMRMDGLGNAAKIVENINKIAGEAPVHHHEEPAAKPTENASLKYFTDVELVNQDGQKMKFYSDLLKGKIVIANSFFTTCTSVCPPMSQRIAKLQTQVQAQLGERAKDVIFLSISVDPETDTPEKLKEYATRFKAQEGWYFLTGTKKNTDWALYKLGQYVDNKDAHTTILIVGNEAKGLWKKTLVMSKVEDLVKIVQDTMNDK